MIIKEVKARVIQDSRGEDTISVSINKSEEASSPSGKSTGSYETKPYYKNLNFCISYLNRWKHATKIMKFNDLAAVESIIKKELKLKNAREFGGNALFAFESAILKAFAKEQRKELWGVVNSKAKKFPRPVGNVIGGGLHTNAKVKPLYQEFLVIPQEDSFAQNVKVMQEIHRLVGHQLQVTKMNDEGAWAAQINDEQALKMLSYFDNIEVGVDMASSSFYYSGLYDYNGKERTPPAHIEHTPTLINTYHLFYVEDPVEENDFQGCAIIKKNVRESMIVGDDLTATHLDRIKEALKNRAISAVIVKPNQNGSLLELKEIVDFCKKHKIQTVMSHRSGETMDSSLADYAFGFQTDFIKCGVATKWREAKLKRMIEIEKSLQ